MTFKYRWFDDIRSDMELWVPRDTKTVVEIGSFEGLSTRFFFDHCDHLRSLIAVDHFDGGEDQQELDIDRLYERFQENTFDYRHRITVLKGRSEDMLCKLQSSEYDLVFVDGSHLAPDVLSDAVHAYRLCRNGGRIVFDDYSWGPDRDDRPQVAIDAFSSVFVGKVTELFQSRIAVFEVSKP